MKRRYQILLRTGGIIGLVILLGGCKTSLQSLPPLEFMDWVENEKNGLKIIKKINGLVYELQYKPVEYIVCMQEKSMEIKKEVLEREKGELGGMKYFTLTIKEEGNGQSILRKDLQSDADYFKRAEFFAFGMQKYLSLEDGEEIIPCSLYHFERNYELAPETKFLLGFASNNENEIEKDGKKQRVQDLVFTYVDTIFNNGPVKINIEKESINQLPELITN